MSDTFRDICRVVEQQEQQQIDLFKTFLLFHLGSDYDKWLEDVWIDGWIYMNSQL